MTRRLCALTCTLLLLSCAFAADAPAPQVRLKLLDMDPRSPAKLHAGDPVYLRIAYESDRPLKIEVVPYHKDFLTEAMTLNDPTLLPAGKGETMGAFGFGEVGQVDEVRVFAIVEGGKHASATVKQPVDFSWDDKVGPERPKADWVTRLMAEQDKHREALKQKQGSAPPSTQDTYYIIGIPSIPATLVFCILWPLWGIVRWRGKWRWLAAAPLTLAVLKGAFTVRDLLEYPDSVYLLPVEYFLLAVVCGIYMVIVWLLRHRTIKSGL